VGVEQAGLRLKISPNAAALVPSSAVESVSTYDHVRGARDGALILGIPTFVVAAVLGGLYAAGIASGCADECPPPPDPVTFGLRVGAIYGLTAAAVGAALGAAAGHEDRYVFTKP
jgi:hypothetical protein